MRSGATCILCAVLLAALCQHATAQIVRWTDEQGEVHISQGLDTVPERYRGSVEVLATPRPTPETGSVGPKEGDIASVASGRATIRFRPGRPIMAVARVNGSAVVSLMIDTGAAITAIHASVLRALGVNLREAPIVSVYGVGGTSQARAVVLDRLEVGGATVAPLRIVVLSTALPGQGVIGQDFLSHFSVNMDNQSGTLTLNAR
jgi:clan AA aspartic protease (TIGR02281 family)